MNRVSMRTLSVGITLYQGEFAFPWPLIAAALIVAIEQWSVRRALRQQTVGQAEAIARTVGFTSGYYVLFGLTDDLHNIVKDVRKMSSTLRRFDVDMYEAPNLMDLRRALGVLIDVTQGLEEKIVSVSLHKAASA